MTNEKSDQPFDDDQAKISALRFELPAHFAEYLHNVVSDAQATGSIVHLITIIPNTPERAISLQDHAVEGCNPKARNCPKSN